MVAIAAIPAQFQRGFLDSFLLAWVPEISEMEISPGWTEESTVTETKSPRPSTAQPKKSKPGPRLATVAGANDLTEVKTGLGSVVMVGREKLQRKTGGFLLCTNGEIDIGFTGDKKQIAIRGAIESKRASLRMGERKRQQEFQGFREGTDPTNGVGDL